MTPNTVPQHKFPITSDPHDEGWGYVRPESQNTLKKVNVEVKRKTFISTKENLPDPMDSEDSADNQPIVQDSERNHSNII